MARPNKPGLDYFSHDTDTDNNRAMRFLEAKFGFVGYGVYFKLCEYCYKQGYYCTFTDEDIEFFAATKRIAEDELRAILDECFKRNLFDRGMFVRHHILTSVGIQERYLEAVRRREHKKGLDITPDYNLVSVNNNSVNVCDNSISVDINAGKEIEIERKYEKEIEIENSEVSATETPKLQQKPSRETSGDKKSGGKREPKLPPELRAMQDKFDNLPVRSLAPG